MGAAWPALAGGIGPTKAVGGGYHWLSVAGRCLGIATRAAASAQPSADRWLVRGITDTRCYRVSPRAASAGGGLSGRSISNRRNDGNYGPCASPLVARTEQAPPLAFRLRSHTLPLSFPLSCDLFLSSLLHPAIEFHPTQPTHFRIFSLLYNSTTHLLAPNSLLRLNLSSSSSSCHCRLSALRDQSSPFHPIFSRTAIVLALAVRRSVSLIPV